MDKMMRAILDRARNVKVIPVAVGVFVGYVGMFVANLATVLFHISQATHTDVVDHPEAASNPHPWSYVFMAVIIQLLFMAIAGFGAAMLAGEREEEHARAMAAVFIFFQVFYVIDVFRRYGLNTDAVAWTFILIGAVPAAVLGARKYVNS